MDGQLMLGTRQLSRADQADLARDDRPLNGLDVERTCHRRGVVGLDHRDSVIAKRR
jgi:hypothetical protein